MKYENIFLRSSLEHVCKALEEGLNIEKIDPQRTLLFLDEIQVVPEL